jgi:hypothetical protein
MLIWDRHGRPGSAKTALTTCGTCNKLNDCLYKERCD